MIKAPISVVITTYNDFEYLEQAIQSVLEQTLLPSEIIIIDDGSEQLEAQAIADQFVDNSKGVIVRFYRKENGGASSARNLGIQKAKQDYLAFLDVDDRMLPSNLQEKYELIQNLDGNYFGVFGGAVRSTGEIEVFPSFDGVANPDLLDAQGQGIPGGSPFFLFNKASLIEIGGFDEKLKCNEDYDIIIRLIQAKKYCKGSTDAGFYRNLRHDSLSRPNDPKKAFNAVMQFLEKAEKNNFYSLEVLNYRKMAAHITCVKGLISKNKFFEAFLLSRAGFKYSKPCTIKQKLIYYFTFSFI